MDRRKGIERRYHHVDVDMERRKGHERRSGHDRRMNYVAVEVDRRE